jgi:SAM-dependent methyltransferase
MASITRPWNIFSDIFGPGTPPARFVQTNNQPTPAVNAEADLASNVRYEDRLTAEKRFYENYVNIQDLPAIHIYWAHELVRPKLLALGLAGPMEMFKKYLKDQYARRKNRPCRFLSIGAGNCDIEIELAKYLCEEGHTHFVIECLDLNGSMLERGRVAAIENEVEGKIDFVEADFNAWQPASEYDAVLANQVLHHVVNLEGLFSQVKRTLKPHGQFIIGDMIGRNGHQRWPEALDIVHEYWRQLPPSYRFNRLLNRYEELYVDWDCSQFGFEGIRAQDILPCSWNTFISRCSLDSAMPSIHLWTAPLDTILTAPQNGIAISSIKSIYVTSGKCSRAALNQLTCWLSLGMTGTSQQFVPSI